MSTAIQRRRGTGAQHTSFTGVLGEITVDTTDNRLVVHDGVTAGGHPVAKESEVTGFAPIANPTFTGVPAAPTAAAATNTTQIATTAFVRTELANLVASAPAALDTLDELAAALGDDANFSTTVTNNLALKAPLASPTFTGNPAAPTPSPGDNDTSIATTAFVTAAVAAASGGASVKRNRYTNPAFQLSSVNGNTSGTTNGYAPADDCAVYRVTSAGTITVQRVQSTTPNGSKDRVRITITAADASLAAGGYLSFLKNTLGQEVADFRYGTASAKQGVVRFGFKGPQGTYAFRRANSAMNRSFVSLFTISAPNANVDTEQEIVVTGDTTGTWLNDSGVGFTDEIVLACGSTFQGTTGWQAGNILGTSGVSNGMGTISAVFEIFDIGNYADFTSTGTAPTWELPEVTHEQLSVGGGSVGRLAAWLNYNGVTNTILASANISSVTDNATGDFTLNFTKALPDANYASVGMGQRTDAGDVALIVSNKQGTAPTASALRLQVFNVSQVLHDPTILSVAVFR